MVTKSATSAHAANREKKYFLMRKQAEWAETSENKRKFLHDHCGIFELPSPSATRQTQQSRTKPTKTEARQPRRTDFSVTVNVKTPTLWARLDKGILFQQQDCQMTPTPDGAVFRAP
jgi:hypothetical protein